VTWPQPILTHKKKGRLSAGMKIILTVLAVVIIGAGLGWRPSSEAAQPTQQQYPQSVAGIFYSSPIITSGGTRISLPYGFVNQNKLVFVDLKLEKQRNELTYQGRTVPLNLYRGGQYLPLVLISTPSGKMISAIRVCEPCGSFSFHIFEGKYLDCDSCRTEWDIETLKGISGGCPNYPPIKLPSSVGSSIEIDLSSLGIRVVS